MLGKAGQKDAGEVVDHARLSIRSFLPSRHSGEAVLGDERQSTLSAAIQNSHRGQEEKGTGIGRTEQQASGLH